MYKTETHLHVSEVSPCSRISAAEMVKAYHEAGYKTLIVSDHFQNGYIERLGDLPWDDKVEHFLSGYEAVKAAAEEFSMNVILSAEIRFNNSRNHYLLYGIDGAFLKQRPDVLDMSIEEFYPYAKERGVTIVQAHPFRDEKCIPMPDYVDGFEVYNSNPRHKNFTEKTLEMARSCNMPMTAGSDTHRDEDIALTGVMTENEIRTVDDYVEALLKGELKMINGENIL